MSNYVTYNVTIRLPRGATVEDGREYIEAAVKGWAGSLQPPNDARPDLQPGDPMFDLDRDLVDVVKATRVLKHDEKL